MGRAFEYRKARKMARWSKMAIAFTRIGKEISIAVKESGSDPSTNSRLRIAIQNAKAANMPKVNVERAIKKATSKEMENFTELSYEGYGPFGVAVIVEAATDNTTRTVANVRAAFNKFDGSLGVNGSVDYMFERKAFFKIKNEGQDVEELELELIEEGLEELDVDGDQIIIQTPFEDFGKMQQALDKQNVEIISADLERIPTTTVSLDEEQREKIDKLLERLEENEDIQNVFHNINEE